MNSRVGWGGWNGAYVNWTPTYANNRLTTNPATGATLSYDFSGNLTNDGYQAYTYDATGQQASASYGGYSLQQLYDGDGVRVRKVENSVTTYYLRSTVLGGKVVAEISSSGTWNRGFVYLGGQMIAIQNGGVNWGHQDPVTNSQRVTNGNGAVISTIDLDPWGGETATSNNQGIQTQRYTTYERDANSGDDAMMRRFTGQWMRFAQPDPYDGAYDPTDPQSFNRYAYVQNDPVNFVDPTGLDECPQGTTSHTDPATGRTECVPGQTASVDINIGPDPDPFWNSFRASAGRPLIIDMTLIPAPLIPNDCISFSNLVDRLATESISDTTFIGNLFDARNDTPGITGFRSNFVDREGGSPNQARHTAWSNLVWLRRRRSCAVWWSGYFPSSSSTKLLR